MDKNSRIALDDAEFALGRAESDMKFHASDANAMAMQEAYMGALDDYLKCLAKCHTKALPLYEAIRVNNDADKFQLLENFTGHEFKRIP